MSFDRPIPTEDAIADEPDSLAADADDPSLHDLDAMSTQEARTLKWPQQHLLLGAELEKKIKVKINGKVKSITRLEAMHRQLNNLALRDPSARKLLQQVLYDARRRNLGIDVQVDTVKVWTPEEKKMFEEIHLLVNQPLKWNEADPEVDGLASNEDDPSVSLNDDVGGK